MGFAATLRRTVQASRNSANAVEDVSALSKNIIKEAENFKVSELSDLFSTKYLKNVDNKLMLGNIQMEDFVRYVRQGNFVNSFQAAFKDTNVLSSAAVQRSARKVLTDAASELPDAALLKATEKTNKIGEKFKLSGKTFSNVDELAEFVKTNPDLAREVNATVRRAKTKRTVKMTGYAATLTAAVVTPAVIYQMALDEAAKNTGCFKYTKKGTELVKCKIGKLSCKNPSDGTLCVESEIADSIKDNKTTCAEGNKDPCLKGQCDTKLYKDLKDNEILKCESKTAGDVLAEAISWASESAIGFIGKSVKTVLIWGLSILGIFIVILFLFRFVFTRFLGG